MNTHVTVVMNCCVCYKSVKFIQHLCGEVESVGYSPVKPLYSLKGTTNNLQMTYRDKLIDLSFDNKIVPDIMVTCSHDNNGDIQAYLDKNMQNSQFAITGNYVHSNLQILDYIVT